MKRPSGASYLTICLSCICDENKRVVAVMDRMITSEGLSIEFEQLQCKIHTISNSCIVMSAGDALAPTDILREAQTEVGKMTKPSISQIATIVKRKYTSNRRSTIEETVLRPRGFDDVNDFYEKMRQLPPDVYTVIDDQVVRFHIIYGVRLEMIVAGTDATGAHIYQVSDPGVASCFDGLGFHAIGSGEPHAVSLITSYDYTGRFLLNQAIWVAYEAKRRSEKAPGVGKGTDICIIDESGIAHLSPKTIACLEEAFSNRQSNDKAWLEKIPDFTKEISSS